MLLTVDGSIVEFLSTVNTLRLIRPIGTIQELLSFQFVPISRTA